MAPSQKIQTKKRGIKIPAKLRNILKKRELVLVPNGDIYLATPWNDPNASVLFGQSGTLRGRLLLMILENAPPTPCPLKKYAFSQKYTSAASVRQQPPLYDYYLQNGGMFRDHFFEEPWRDLAKEAESLWNALCQADVTVAWAPSTHFHGRFSRLLRLADLYPQVPMSAELVQELHNVPMWTHGRYHRVDSNPLHRHLDAFFQQLQALDLLKTYLPQPAVQARLLLGAGSGEQDASTLHQLDVNNLPLDQLCALANTLRCLVPNLPPPQ